MPTNFPLALTRTAFGSASPITRAAGAGRSKTATGTPSAPRKAVGARRSKTASGTPSAPVPAPWRTRPRAIITFYYDAPMEDGGMPLQDLAIGGLRVQGDLGPLNYSYTGATALTMVAKKD